MASYIQEMKSKGLISPPKFLHSSIQYEVLMGSQAYAVSNSDSDWDVYGFCIPPKYIVFPHTAGYINKFDNDNPVFDQFQEHHVNDESKNRVYDFTIYSIVKYFKLVMDNNPNMIDSLFVPRRCILYTTQLGELVRENRKLFLHKGCWHKFKGYAYAQLKKMKSQTRTGVRKEVVEKYGYDIKFAYHVVRLINEVEQILNEGDLDLERSSAMLRDIRDGNWSLERVEKYFQSKEAALETCYQESKLPHSPDKERIRNLLMECLEIHYGSIDECVNIQSKYETALRDIKIIVDKQKLNW